MKKTCIFHSKILDKYFDQEKKKRGDRLSFQQFNQYGLVKTGEGVGEKKTCGKMDHYMLFKFSIYYSKRFLIVLVNFILKIIP